MSAKAMQEASIAQTNGDIKTTTSPSTHEALEIEEGALKNGHASELEGLLHVSIYVVMLHVCNGVHLRHTTYISPDTVRTARTNVLSPSQDESDSFKRSPPITSIFTNPMVSTYLPTSPFSHIDMHPVPNHPMLLLVFTDLC